MHHLDWYHVRMTDYVPPAKVVYVQRIVKRCDGRFMMKGPINTGWRTVLLDVAFADAEAARRYSVQLSIVLQPYFM